MIWWNNYGISPSDNMRTCNLLLKYLNLFQVIEADAQPSDLCTRREYARWLVSASSVLSRFVFLIIPMFGSI